MIGSRSTGCASWMPWRVAIERGQSERELVRVHGVERAVVQGRLEVDDRIARDRPLVGDVPDTLLDAREELARHDPAHDALGERDAAAGVRLELQPDMAELAAPAGLLLVAALDLGAAPDRLAIGDPGRMDQRPRSRTCA